LQIQLNDVQNLSTIEKVNNICKLKRALRIVVQEIFLRLFISNSLHKVELSQTSINQIQQNLISKKKMCTNVFNNLVSILNDMFIFYPLIKHTRD